MLGEVKAKAAMIRAEGNIEPKLVAVVSNLEKYDYFHPTIAMPSEELLEDFSRSYADFLLNNQVLKVQVNQVLMCKETKYLSKHVIVAYFVGDKPS